MNSFVQSLANAQQSVSEIDTRDISSLAYVSGLVALESILPNESASELDFEVAVLENGSIHVEVKEVDIDAARREAINAVASHYFLARKKNIPISVH